MKKHIFSKNVITSIVVIILAVLLTLISLQIIYIFDNKYNSIWKNNQDDITNISGSDVNFLVNGWELYPDKLLEPTDFSNGKYNEKYKTWIGQYPNLSLFHHDKNPYGVATYRIFLSGEGINTLYLQEPFCATRIFVDGVEIAGNGVISEYSPHIKDTLVSFSVNEKTELIIQTANYSHYYGGIWYPPIIGNSDNVSHLVGLRLIIYGFLSFTAIALSVFCLSNWFGQKKRDSISFYFGVLCLAFGIRVCYPFVRFLGIPLITSLYALEDFATMVSIYCTLCISLLLVLNNKFDRLKNISKTISFAMCIFTVIFHIIILPNYPNFTVLYGQTISWYKLIMSMFLILVAMYGCFARCSHSKLMLTAVTVNGVCIFYGVLSLGRFEPIIGAWPEEYGAYFMVICFVILMMMRTKKMVADNLHLTDNLQKEVEAKTKHLKLLLAERGQLISELGHDMKSPLSAFSRMSQSMQFDDNITDESTKLRMQSIEHKCNVLSERLRILQELTEESIVSINMDTIVLNEFLLGFYKINKPVIELDGPDFVYHGSHTTCKIYGNEENISRVLENLIYNATDFTPGEGEISISLEWCEKFAIIAVSDTGCGISEENLPRIFDRYYSTRKDNRCQGLGLAIARFIILEHGGEITVDSIKGKGCTFTIKLPLI